jgi:hypothetical protein
MGILVDKYGLDFGDSVWLSWQYVDQIRSSNAFGFFSRYFSTGLKEPLDFFEFTRAFNEGIREYHIGNVDHFHSFLAKGPRVTILDRFERGAEGTVDARFGKFQWAGPWNCSNAFVFGICVVGIQGQPLDVRAVTLFDKDEKAFSCYTRTAYDPPPNGREHRLFVAFEPPEANAPVPSLSRVSRVAVEFADPAHAANLEKILLLNAHGDIIVQRLALLRRGYNVEMSLVTEHAAQHFRNPPSRPAADENLKKHIASYNGPAEAYNGRLTDDDGNLVFSTDADDPYSFCRVFPEISRDLEFRFIVPHPAPKAHGWSPFEVVTPSPTRSGGGIYWARRVLPNIGAPRANSKFDSNSRQDTFASRMTRVLEQAGESPGLFWPIYTHLGSLSPSALRPGEAMGNAKARSAVGDRDQVPSPYFDPSAMDALQDHVFNISGQIPAQSRIWFARATVAYDYTLILRSIADHVERPDENTVLISSWFDPCLGKMLPRSPAQLYGLTFYVDDPGRAKVFLDGRRLETLVVNPIDETGRPSVSIAECDIRYVVFDKLDPVVNTPSDVTYQNLAWHWTPSRAESAAFGRLLLTGENNGETAGPKEQIGRFTLPLFGWTPTGAQLLTFSVSMSGKTKFGLLFKTRTGGTFYFGDKAMPSHLPKNVTASYFLPPRQGAPGDWHTVTVPFHDLAWLDTASAGGPMPNHPMGTLTVMFAGPKGSFVRIRGLAFLRPRSVAQSPESAGLFCVGGVVPGSRPGQTVYAENAAGRDKTILSAVVDQRGYFSFGCIRPDIYKVWTVRGDQEIHDLRGALVEVGANTMNLVLNRRGGIAAAPVEAVAT